jgi:hypothetical protein
MCLLDWCLKGAEINVDEISCRIGECRSIQELLSLYKMFPQFQQALKPEFETRKRELIVLAPSDEMKSLAQAKYSSNGNI